MSAAQTYTSTQPFAQRWQCHAFLALLTLIALLTHGYHPFAEDGGLYVAGIEYRLNPLLFPHDAPFVTAHLGWSVFATLLAHLVRFSHLPLPWILFAVYLSSVYASLYAAFTITWHSFSSQKCAFWAAVLLASCMTLPIAGTALLLMDPYVTARSFSTPLSLLALAFALRARSHRRWNSYLLALCFLLAAGAFHPLMASYAAALVLALVISQLEPSRSRVLGWAIFAAVALFVAAALQFIAVPASAASSLADASRYYWFLSQWRWFELLGLVAPLLIFMLAAREYARREIPGAAALSRAASGLGLLACAIAGTFAQQHFNSHVIARLQPLRAFLLIYALMIVVLSALCTSYLASRRNRLLKLAPLAIAASIAAVMFYVQRQTFPASRHIELPWRAAANPWSQAFLWARDHTPSDALFALDSDYISQPGEDAQTFRATAQRSMLADFSKDGGEAAITPSLAEGWLTQSSAQEKLSLLGDAQRDAHLHGFGVTWMVLQASAKTVHPCPYNNHVVKVCANSQPPLKAPLP